MGEHVVVCVVFIKQLIVNELFLSVADFHKFIYDVQVNDTQFQYSQDDEYVIFVGVPVLPLPELSVKLPLVSFNFQYHFVFAVIS